MEIVIIVYIVLIIFIAIVAVVLMALIKYLRSGEGEKGNSVFSRSLGKKLKQQRETRGMSVEDAAKALGVNNKTLIRWEDGAKIPDTTTLYSLADLYQINIEDLLKDVKAG